MRKRETPKDAVKLRVASKRSEAEIAAQRERRDAERAAEAMNSKSRLSKEPNGRFSVEAGSRRFVSSPPAAFT
jgi:hypothetical protein